MNDNFHLNQAIRKLKELAADKSLTPDQRADLLDILDDLFDAKITLQEAHDRLMLDSIRNPSFIGDMVGWLDDDFDDDDDDTDEPSGSQKN